MHLLGVANPPAYNPSSEPAWVFMCYIASAQGLTHFYFYCILQKLSMLYSLCFNDAIYEESVNSVVRILLYIYIKLRSRNSLSPYSSYSIFQSFKILMDH